MFGTILVYGNEELLVTTRHLILEKAGYEVFSATQFADAMLVLMNQQIDVLLLCQSLNDEELRGMSETACAVKPETKCAVLGFDGRDIALDGVEVLERLGGPPALLKAIGRILRDEASSQTNASL
jgi:DNA-binding response OmpR family regulator